MPSLKEEFLKFHEENPWVYVRMVDHCRALLARGYTEYSARTLISVMRYEWDLKTTGEEVRFKGDVDTTRVKLNNNHSPYYARMISIKHPEFAEFFSFREIEEDDDGIYPDPPPMSIAPPLAPAVQPLPALETLALCVNPLRAIYMQMVNQRNRDAVQELGAWIVEACKRHGVAVPTVSPSPSSTSPSVQP